MIKSDTSRVYKVFPVLLLLFVNLFFVGCGAGVQRRWPRPADFLPAHHHIDAVPFYPQKINQCGPAALAMVLQWSGVPSDPDKLSGQVFTPSRQGSLQSAMIAAARRNGRVAYPLSEPMELVTEIAAGNPVIVLQNLGLSWYPVWHYAVAIGFDLKRNTIVLHSGETANRKQSQKIFERTWARSNYWGLLVLPPSRLPAEVEQQKYVTAVSGLEKARQWQAAVTGYRTALSRWPNDRYAWMGLGNSYYASGDRKAAEDAFREATRRFPSEGAAFNNLAQVLWEQGKSAAALQAARKAVALGGPLIHIYRETLEEIEKGIK